MPRLFPRLLLAALLLAPVAAPAQTPGFTLEQTRTLRWSTLALQHTKAADIVQEMHWSSQPANSIFTLPPGTKYVFAEPPNTLLVLATPDGFEETKNIVKALDKTGYAFAPTLTFLSVPAGDTHIRWIEDPAAGLEVTAVPGGAKAFQEIMATGAVAKAVKIDQFLLYDPIDLIADTPHLHGDGLLTLDFAFGCWNGPPVQVSGVHRGDVLAVRGKQLFQVTLIRVNY